MTCTDWHSLIPLLPRLQRPLRVAMPCVGIDGCGTALDAMGVDFIPCNICDHDTRYEDHLVKHVKNPADVRFDKTCGSVRLIVVAEQKLDCGGEERHLEYVKTLWIL